MYLYLTEQNQEIQITYSSLQEAYPEMYQRALRLNIFLAVFENRLHFFHSGKYVQRSHGGLFLHCTQHSWLRLTSRTIRIGVPSYLVRFSILHFLQRLASSLRSPRSVFPKPTSDALTCIIEAHRHTIIAKITLKVIFMSRIILVSALSQDRSQDHWVQIRVQNLGRQPQTLTK